MKKPSGFAWRQLMLRQNMELVKDHLRTAIGSFRDPVTLIADLTDFQGEQVAICAHRSNGMSVAEAAAKIEADKSRFGPDETPTFHCVVELDDAKRILPNTSPTALQTIENALRLRKPGQYLAVVIADGGNSYTWVFPE